MPQGERVVPLALSVSSHLPASGRSSRDHKAVAKSAGSSEALSVFIGPGAFGDSDDQGLGRPSEDCGAGGGGAGVVGGPAERSSARAPLGACLNSTVLPGVDPFQRMLRLSPGPPTSSSGLTYADVQRELEEAPNPFALEGRARRASDEAARRASGLPSPPGGPSYHVPGPRATHANLLYSREIGLGALGGLPPSAFSAARSSALAPTLDSATAQPCAQTAHLLHALRSSATRSPPSSSRDASRLIGLGREAAAKENRPPTPAARRPPGWVADWRDEVHRAVAARAKAAEGVVEAAVEAEVAPSPQEPVPQVKKRAARKKTVRTQSHTPSELSPPKRRLRRKRVARAEADENGAAAAAAADRADETAVSTKDLVAMLPKRARRFGTVRENEEDEPEEEEEEEETDYELLDSPSRRRSKRKPTVARSRAASRKKQRCGTDSQSDNSESLRQKEATRKKWDEVDSFALEVVYTL